MQTTTQFPNSSPNHLLNSIVRSKYERRYKYKDVMLVALKHNHWLIWLRLNKLYRLHSKSDWIPFYVQLIRAYSDNIIELEDELFRPDETMNF